jgi:hypothetical protein
MNRLASGLIGAVALTAIHETARRIIPEPPRMDVVGGRAVEQLYRLAGCQPPDARRLYGITMAGDVISNALYYSAIAGGSRGAIWGKGVALGLAAGVGAVALPERLGLGTPPHNERVRTRILTVAWYMAGAMIAAAVASPTVRRRQLGGW